MQVNSRKQVVNSRIIVYIIDMLRKTPPTFLLGDDFYSKLEKFAANFIKEGELAFGQEFHNVGDYYLNAVADQSRRDDHQFRRSPVPLYILEAVSFAVHDRCNRDDFNKAKETAIIIPQCLAIMQGKCKRKRTSYGKICDSCVPRCQVNEISQISRQYGVAVYFSQRKLERQLDRIHKKNPSLSVIGISCILTLASGMRTARDLGIPARGVLLKYTGCDHWINPPFATETAVDRVEIILREKYGLSDSSSRPY